MILRICGAFVSSAAQLERSATPVERVAVISSSLPIEGPPRHHGPSTSGSSSEARIDQWLADSVWAASCHSCGPWRSWWTTAITACCGGGEGLWRNPGPGNRDRPLLPGGVAGGVPRLFGGAAADLGFHCLASGGPVDGTFWSPGEAPLADEQAGDFTAAEVRCARRWIKQAYRVSGGTIPPDTGRREADRGRPAVAD